MSAARPLVTANQVTLARLALMPVVAWLAWQDTVPLLWAAVALGTVLGATDFVDGMLARRQGPTVLGGLLDPIADRVFVACVYVPFVDLGLLPALPVGLLFVREFIASALRTIEENRGLGVRITWWGRTKTWVEMQGIGVILLFPLLGFGWTLRIVLLAFVLVPALLVAVSYVATRRVFRGGLAMAGFMLYVLALHEIGDVHTSITLALWTVVAVSWLAGVGYVARGVQRARSLPTAAEVVRLVGAVLVPTAVIGALVASPAPPWAVVAVLLSELAVGGLDNLLASRRAAAGAAPWGVRILLVSASLIAGVRVPAWAPPLAVAAAAASILAVAIEFRRGRPHYWGLRAAPAAP